jgi:hypothetical protein
MVAPYTWSFTTDTVAAIGPAPVVLGTAGDYVVLAKSEVTNVPTSAVTGDVGLSPAAASFITGFAMTRVGTYWTSPQVTGNIFASDNDPPTPTNLNVAILNMETAYTDAAGRPTPKFLNLGAGDIGGKTPDGRHDLGWRKRHLDLPGGWRSQDGLGQEDDADRRR